MSNSTTLITAFDALPLRCARPVADQRVSSPPCYIEGSHTVQFHKGATHERRNSTISSGGNDSRASAVYGRHRHSPRLFDTRNAATRAISSRANLRVDKRASSALDAENTHGTCDAGNLSTSRWRQSSALSVCISILPCGGQLKPFRLQFAKLVDPQLGNTCTPLRDRRQGDSKNFRKGGCATGEFYCVFCVHAFTLAH